MKRPWTIPRRLHRETWGRAQARWADQVRRLMLRRRASTDLE